MFRFLLRNLETTIKNKNKNKKYKNNTIKFSVLVICRKCYTSSHSEQRS